MRERLSSATESVGLAVLIAVLAVVAVLVVVDPLGVALALRKGFTVTYSLATDLRALLTQSR